MARIEKHPRGYRARWEAGKDADGKRIRRSRVFVRFEDAKGHLRKVASTEGYGSGSGLLGDEMVSWITYRLASGRI